jgi:hypothetical protein
MFWGKVFFVPDIILEFLTTTVHCITLKSPSPSPTATLELPVCLQILLCRPSFWFVVTDLYELYFFFLYLFSLSLLKFVTLVYGCLHRTIRVVLGLHEESGPEIWMVRSFELQSRALNLRCLLQDCTGYSRNCGCRNFISARSLLDQR